MKNNEYPKVIYGYAILLDNKIENWNIEDLEIDFQKAIKE